jgi:hypothetical protein
MVRDVDDQHRSSMVAFEADRRGILSSAVDRRRFVEGEDGPRFVPAFEK